MPVEQMIRYRGGCTHAVMESTGSYWEPIFNVLEISMCVVLANPQRGICWCCDDSLDGILAIFRGYFPDSLSDHARARFLDNAPEWAFPVVAAPSSLAA
jgi:hypothetical protein